MEGDAVGCLRDSSILETLGPLVRQTLAAKGRLCPVTTRLSFLPIRVGTELRGLHFALHGPRQVLLTAVWDASTGALWCYDSRGERFAAEAPGPAAPENV